MSFTKTLSIAAIASALAAGAPAQTPRSTSEAENHRIVTAEAPPGAARANASAAQLEFLADALRSSLGEIRMGELATQQSHDQRVRAYGEKLKADHTTHAAELERLLETRSVTVPTEPTTEALAHVAALGRLSGQEFDAAFVQMMIWTHTDAVEQYGAQTHANPDRALHDFASNSLLMLREHLAAAEALR